MRDEVSQSGGIEVVLHLEAIASVMRHVLITDDGLRPRVPPVVPVLASRLPREAAHGVSKRPPLLEAKLHSLGVTVCRLRPGDLASSDADHDRAATALWYSEVCCIENTAFDGVAQLVLSRGPEGVVLGGAQQFWNVLHYEGLRTALPESSHVLTPERSAFETDPVPVER
jgi:hypothetical protein